MKEWCMIHYNMTFWIIIFFLYLLFAAVDNILTVLNNKIKLKAMKFENKVEGIKK